MAKMNDLWDDWWNSWQGPIATGFLLMAVILSIIRWLR